MADRVLSHVISRDYARQTGGWIYGERVLSGLRELGWTIERTGLPAGFPDAGEDAIGISRRLLETLPEGRLVLIDQICLSAMPEAARDLSGHLNFVMLFHHPISREYGETLAPGSLWFDREKTALAYVRLAITSSPLTAETLKLFYGVDEGRVLVASPGVEKAP